MATDLDILKRAAEYEATGRPRGFPSGKWGYQTVGATKADLVRLADDGDTAMDYEPLYCHLIVDSCRQAVMV